MGQIVQQASSTTILVLLKLTIALRALQVGPAMVLVLKSLLESVLLDSTALSVQRPTNQLQLVR
jgi:hypothetical protein